MALVSFNGSSISKGNKYLSLNAAAVAGGVTQVKATGGSESTVGVYRVHDFTSSGTFTVNTKITVEYLIISGGNGGTGIYQQQGSYSPQGPWMRFGGGAASGRYLISSTVLDPGTYSITVGAGGAAGDLVLLSPTGTAGRFDASLGRPGGSSSLGSTTVSGPPGPSPAGSQGGSNGIFSGGYGGAAYPNFATPVGGGGAGVAQAGFPGLSRNQPQQMQVSLPGAGGNGIVLVGWAPTPISFGGGGRGGGDLSGPAPQLLYNPFAVPAWISTGSIGGGGISSMGPAYSSVTAGAANTGGGGGNVPTISNAVPAAPTSPSARGAAGGSGRVMIRYVI